MSFSPIYLTMGLRNNYAEIAYFYDKIIKSQVDPCNAGNSPYYSNIISHAELQKKLENHNVKSVIKQSI